MDEFFKKLDFKEINRIYKVELNIVPSIEYTDKILKEQFEAFITKNKNSN